MKTYEEPEYDGQAESNFASPEGETVKYMISGDDDDEEEETEEIPDNDWGDVDPLDTPLRRMPDPMDPSGPGSAV